MPRCWPSAVASVDLPAPIIPAMPMNMLPNASGAGRARFKVATGAACQTAMTCELASALVAHHPLNHALARLGDLALLAQAVGAVGAHLARLAPNLHRDQLLHLVIAFAAGRHASIVSAPRAAGGGATRAGAAGATSPTASYVVD